MRARFARQQCRAWIETGVGQRPVTDSTGFARQQCRAWIETQNTNWYALGPIDSPGSNAGRGLKHL